MRIDHIAIWVQDLERMKDFYQTYFSMACNDKYVNAKKGFSSYFLSFENGARIEIMHRSDISDRLGERDGMYGLTHLAISVGSKMKVDELTERIRRDGFKIEGEARVTGDAYYESVIQDPEGNSIEITD
ncbi:VOC family protein [Ancylomarina sp. YFZ004]